LCYGEINFKSDDEILNRTESFTDVGRGVFNKILKFIFPGISEIKIAATEERTY
jgi:hypothetical protein